MELIFGGAYQGKLDYAKEKYSLLDDDVFYCQGLKLDLNKKCIYGLEKFSLDCVKNGFDAVEMLEKLELDDKIIIVCDISCGVVPIDNTVRAWREMNGKMLSYLSQKARSVIRVFCGLAEVVKKTNKLYLIRHALTEGVEKGWLYGAADLPITENGIAIAKSYVNDGIYPLDNIGDLKFFVTGLTRTIQTLKTIFGDVEYGIIPAFQEVNYGDYECKTVDELKDDEYFNIWVNDTSRKLAPPNGESYEHFYTRIKDRFDKFLLEMDSDCVIVCHGGTIGNMMNSVFGSGSETFYNFLAQPCRGFIVDVVNGKAVSYKKL